MKKVLFYILLSLSMVSVSAQDRLADSLKLALKKINTDTGRVNLLVKLSEFYYLQKPDSGLFYATQAEALSKKIRYKRGELHALTQKGFSYYMLGNQPEALQNFLTAQHMAVATNDNWSLGRIYDGLSGVYYDEGELKTGIIYARKAEALFRQVHDYVNVVDELMDITIFAGADNQLDTALAAGNQALALSLKINEKKWRSQVLTNLGLLHVFRHNYKLGFSYLHQGFSFATKYDQQLNLINACFFLSTAYKMVGNRDSCIYFAKKGFDLAHRGSFSRNVASFADRLAEQYYGINNNLAAYYYRLSARVKDSLFNTNTERQVAAIQGSELQHAADLKNAAIAYQNKLRLAAVLAILTLAIIILLLVWRNNRKQRATNKLLAKQKQQIEDSLEELRITQNHLIQAEKMASLGELTAGIAHEIQNPLNFVNNFSEVSIELLSELQEEEEKGYKEEVLAIAGDLAQNLQKIAHHGKRADGIVKGMLEHSRISTGQKEPTDLNKLADEYLRLAYHGLRAKDKEFNAELITRFDEKLPNASVIPQDMGRVLLNLFNNAFYAVREKAKTAGPNYKPTVEVSTFTPPLGGWGVKVFDNGNGIPDSIKEKIMQPFFTTKPTGEGTGLGLSLSYDIIVKGHNGKIEVNSEENNYTEFTISIPE